MAREGQTHVLAKLFPEHAEVDSPHVIATMTLDQWRDLYAEKGFALVNAYGEPVDSEEKADPDAQTELVAEREEARRAQRTKELVEAAKKAGSGKAAKDATTATAPAVGTGV